MEVHVVEDTSFSFTSLLIVTVLSFIVPIVITKLKRIHIPIVVGEILAGILIGKSGFNLVAMDDWLNFIMFFGLAYLMFTSGLEIDFNILFDKTNRESENTRKSWQHYLKNPVLFSTIILFITLIFAYFVSFVMMKIQFVKDPLLMSLIIGTTSLGVVVPILKEKKISGTPFGQYIITNAVMADFVTMLLISVAVSLFKGGFRPEILLVFGLLLLVFVFYWISKKFEGNKLFEDLAHGTAQIGIRGSFALMLIFLVLAESIGVEMILGAFLAGVVVSLISQNRREEIYHKLDAIGFGFLIPMFFILVGVTFDLNILIHNPKALLFVPILFILTYLVKGTPALLLRLFFPWKKTIAGSILLTTQMSVTIAAAAIGLQVGAISPEVNATIVLVAILTSITSPILFGKLFPPSLEEKEDEHVLIIGATKNAILLAKNLLKSGMRTLIIDSDRKKIDEVTRIGVEGVFGDAMDLSLLDELEIEKSKSMIIATGNDQINFQIAEKMANQYRLNHLVVLLSDPILIDKAKSNRNIRIINPKLSTVSLLMNMIKHPLAADILEDRRDLHMEEVEITNPRLIGISLRYLKLARDVLISSIYRNGETLLPHGDSEFQFGDILLVLGTTDAVQEFKRHASTL